MKVLSTLNQTPSGERVHVSFFGRRNAGKSSLVNAVTGQEISVVSNVAGTTTDPVTKAMELLPVGPVLIIDTPGIDDEGELGEKRVTRTMRILNKTDVAVLVVDSSVGFTESDNETKRLIKSKDIPLITVYSKSDLNDTYANAENTISVSAKSGDGINELKELIAQVASQGVEERRIIGDKLSESDTVILVTPIDSSAPKGRLILPQVQTIRDILDSHGMCLTVQPDQLPHALDSLKEPPKLVITDSQVFGNVKSIVPESVPLTSFSILMAAYKGILPYAVDGIAGIHRLKSGSRVLISEGCSHHRQCEDIGTVKLPAMLKRFTGIDDLNFTFTSGGEFPAELSSYDLIIHCGGCMLPSREVLYRAKCATDAGIPFTNYGTAMAYMNGILSRSLSCFPELSEKLQCFANV